MLNTYTGVLVAVTCCHAKCGVTFGLDADHEKNLRRTHENFTCPNGHSQHFSDKTEEERLKDELAREKHRREQAQAEAEHQRQEKHRAERKAAAARGRITKLKNRAHAGVCLECNRTFQNVARHMETKHPHGGAFGIPKAGKS